MHILLLREVPSLFCLWSHWFPDLLDIPHIQGRWYSLLLLAEDIFPMTIRETLKFNSKLLTWSKSALLHADASTLMSLSVLGSYSGESHVSTLSEVCPIDSSCYMNFICFGTEWPTWSFADADAKHLLPFARFLFIPCFIRLFNIFNFWLRII